MHISWVVQMYLVVVIVTACEEECQYVPDLVPSLAVCEICEQSESNLYIAWASSQTPFRMLPGSYVTFGLLDGAIGVTTSPEVFRSCIGTGDSTRLPIGEYENATIYLPQTGVLYFVSQLETKCSGGEKVRGVVERKLERYNGWLVLLIVLPSIPIFCLGVSIKRLTLLFSEGAFFGTLATATEIGIFVFWRSYVRNFVEILDVDWEFWFWVAFSLFCSSLLVNFIVVVYLIQFSRSSFWLFPCSIATPWFIRLAYSTSMSYDDSIAGRDGLVMVVLTNSAIFYQITPQLFFQLMYWFQRGFLFRDQEHLGYISTLGIVSMLSDSLCLVILLLQFICPVDWERDEDDEISIKKPTPQKKTSNTTTPNHDESYGYKRSGADVQPRKTSFSVSVELMPDHMSPTYRQQRFPPRKELWRKKENRRGNHQGALEQRTGAIEDPSGTYHSHTDQSISTPGRTRVRSSTPPKMHKRGSSPQSASARKGQTTRGPRRPNRVPAPYRSQSSGYQSSSSSMKKRNFKKKSFENVIRSHSDPITVSHGDPKSSSPFTYYNYGRSGER